ncbi:uncharacterized protein QC763_501395 [Podospora pseudopauciseta]|uniref:Fungal N-terminal domain-containing protein n=1 Tax=Podospora pseudopauciseta TaxID=2093780 RepID=A0ABR0H7R4_9PEZI|nr:hypothetical protein QC763_501395 [Podospora pseudopauciseta]
MSSGYSVGDFVAGAEMAQKLHILVKTSADTPSEYEAAMKELVLTQQAFITVSQLSQNQVFLPRNTISAASFLISSSLDTISKFLKRTESLKKSLSSNGPPTIRDSGCRIGWELYGKDELRELREKLHNCLAALNLLLSAANLGHRSILPPSTPSHAPTLDQNDGYTSESTCVDLEVVDLIGEELGSMRSDHQTVNESPKTSAKPSQLKTEFGGRLEAAKSPASSLEKPKTLSSTGGPDHALLERLAVLEKLAAEKKDWESSQAERRKNADFLIRHAESAFGSKLQGKSIPKGI